MSGRVTPSCRGILCVVIVLAAVACRPPATVVAGDNGIVPDRVLPTPGDTLSWDRRAEDAAILLGPEKPRDYYGDHWTLTITSTAAEQAPAKPRPPRPPGVIVVALLGVAGLVAFLGLTVFAALREREPAGPVAITRTSRGVLRD